MNFSDLDLHPKILKAINDVGYKTPTDVQTEVIPLALKDKDLLVSSKTGSGKTAAFVLPSIQKLMSKQNEEDTNAKLPVSAREKRRSLAKPKIAKPHMLIMTPTRELTIQVTEAILKYSKYTNIKIGSILGGMPYFQQLKMLSSSPNIIVATPGRLIDHIDNKKISLINVNILVLDEADRMLDMGFIDDIEDIISKTPEDKQTMLFSATLDGLVGNIAKKITNDPATIKIANVEIMHDSIIEVAHVVDDALHKVRLIKHLLLDQEIKQAIIFADTQKDVEILANKLIEEGLQAKALHGGMNQGQRNRTLNSFRTKRLKFLVATNVAARGIDIPTVSHVFNMNIPKEHEEYIHRIGRTGRAGRSGKAISLATHSEMRSIEKIGQKTKKNISVSEVDGFEPKRPYVPDSSRKKNSRNLDKRIRTIKPYNSKHEQKQSYDSYDDERYIRRKRSTKSNYYSSRHKDSSSDSNYSHRDNYNRTHKKDSFRDRVITETYRPTYTEKLKRNRIERNFREDTDTDKVNTKNKIYKVSGSGSFSGKNKNEKNHRTTKVTHISHQNNDIRHNKHNAKSNRFPSRGRTTDMNHSEPKREDYNKQRISSRNRNT